MSELRIIVTDKVLRGTHGSVLMLRPLAVSIGNDSETVMGAGSAHQ